MLICHIGRLPGSTVGAKARSIKGFIAEHVKESHAQLDNFDLSKYKIHINISRDGSKITRNINFVLLSFFVLQYGKSVILPKETEQLQCFMDMKTTTL